MSRGSLLHASHGIWGWTCPRPGLLDHLSNVYMIKAGRTSDDIANEKDMRACVEMGAISADYWTMKELRPLNRNAPQKGMMPQQ